MKKDVSIHFTIKGQTIEEINNKLDNYLTFRQTVDFDFSEESSPRSVLHHCFLPEKEVIAKGFSNEIYEEILHPLSNDKICWFGVSDYGINHDRILMLENLAKLNGLAIFIGNINEGVATEYGLAKELGIECILIP